jgi:hypothetical protein
VKKVPKEKKKKSKKNMTEEEKEAEKERENELKELERQKEMWRKKKKYKYHSVDSFQFEEVLFDDVKLLGFSPMHKRVRVVENSAHMSEHKWARAHHFDLYFGDKHVKTKLCDTRAVQSLLHIIISKTSSDADLA